MDTSEIARLHGTVVQPPSISPDAPYNCGAAADDQLSQPQDYHPVSVTDYDGHITDAAPWIRMCELRTCKQCLIDALGQVSHMFRSNESINQGTAG